MKQHSETPQPAVTPAPSAKPDADRRRFIVAGLVTAPLLVTLTARPASANWEQNGSLGNYGSATP
jgi:hypothetical protein